MSIVFSEIVSNFTEVAVQDGGHAEHMAMSMYMARKISNLMSYVVSYLLFIKAMTGTVFTASNIVSYLYVPT